MFGVWVPQLLMPFSQWGRMDAFSLLNCKIKQITMCPCEKLEISKFGFLCMHYSILRGFSDYCTIISKTRVVNNSSIVAQC